MRLSRHPRSLLSIPDAPRAISLRVGVRSLLVGYGCLLVVLTFAQLAHDVNNDAFIGSRESEVRARDLPQVGPQFAVQHRMRAEMVVA